MEDKALPIYSVPKDLSLSLTLIHTHTHALCRQEEAQLSVDDHRKMI